MKMADGFSQQVRLSVCFKSIVRSQYGVKIQSPSNFANPPKPTKQ